MTQTRLKKQRLQKYVGNRFGEKTNQDEKMVKVVRFAVEGFELTRNEAKIVKFANKLLQNDCKL